MITPHRESVPHQWRSGSADCTAVRCPMLKTAKTASSPPIRCSFCLPDLRRKRIKGLGWTGPIHLPPQWAQELEVLFGMRPAEALQPGSVADAPPANAAPDGSSRSGAASVAAAAQPQTCAVAAAQGEELSVGDSEPKPTESPKMAHPKPTASGRLTHVDKQGRAAMVDVGKVRVWIDVHVMMF